jgi:hypothetical protein
VSNLREAYASTALASLEWSEERERAIDRVAAAGRCSRLGVDLWKARYMLESKAYQDAFNGLVAAYLVRYRAESQGIAEKCVSEALHEFLGPVCTVCNGRKVLIAEALKIECDVCHGSGIRLYSDVDRAHAMQLSLGRVRSLNPKLGWLMNELHDLDRAVNSVIAAELERA